MVTVYIYIYIYIPAKIHLPKSCRFLFQSRNDVHLLHIHATAKEVGSYKDTLFEGLTSIVRYHPNGPGGFLKGLVSHDNIHDSDFTTLNFEHHTF